MSKLTSANGFQENLTYLNGRISNCNSAHGRAGADALKTAVTEANVNYKNSVSDGLNGTGVNSFVGAQFIAEMMSIGMKNNLSFLNMWSVVEGSGTDLNIGYIDAFTGKRKP